MVSIFKSRRNRLSRALRHRWEKLEDRIYCLICCETLVLQENWSTKSAMKSNRCCNKCLSYKIFPPDVEDMSDEEIDQEEQERQILKIQMLSATEKFKAHGDLSSWSRTV